MDEKEKLRWMVDVDKAVVQLQQNPMEAPLLGDVELRDLILKEWYQRLTPQEKDYRV